MDKIIREDPNGFIYKDVKDKKNYAMYHKDFENGKKLLGWIMKACVKHMNDKES